MFPETNCSENYVGKNARCISERIIYHNGRDQNRYLFKNSCCKNYLNASKSVFKIICSGFKNTYLQIKNCRNTFKKTNQTIIKRSREVLWTETAEPKSFQKFLFSRSMFIQNTFNCFTISINWLISV